MKHLDYAIIGNCSTAALISKNASLDFLCLPHFQSQTVFASLLDQKKGGTFSINVSAEYKVTQSYLENTNILITHFSNGKDCFELCDFMPRYHLDNGDIYHPPELIRFFRYISGKPQFSLNYEPKLDYARGTTKQKVHSNYLKHTSQNTFYESLYCYSSFKLDDIKNKKKIVLNQNAYVLINYNQKILPLSMNYIYLQYIKTKTYWLGWSSKTLKIKEFEGAVKRSILTLKLLTYEKTGALLAAATTSLPEEIGKNRNWDYRYCWIRDAALTVSVFHQLGHRYLSKKFIDFILNVTPYKREELQIMYDIHGRKQFQEESLLHLSGYLDSQPVRIGNEAFFQKQWDIYGFLMDIMHTSLTDYKNNLDQAEHLWTMVRNIVRHVQSNWEKKDSGPWEFRDNKQHFVFSKLLCWVAIDRAIKIAKRLKQFDNYKHWEDLAFDIKKSIEKKGFCKKKKSYMQSYSSPYVDASVLLMESYGFISAKSPRYISTVEYIHTTLCHDDGLMYRYNGADDFGKPKSAFLVCSFWMIDALYKIGKKKQAKHYFNTLLNYRNHVGLFSEDVDIKSKRLLGNFPQAYSHLALISTALLLSNKKPYNPNDFFDGIVLE